MTHLPVVLGAVAVVCLIKVVTSAAAVTRARLRRADGGRRGAGAGAGRRVLVRARTRRPRRRPLPRRHGRSGLAGVHRRDRAADGRHAVADQRRLAHRGEDRAAPDGRSTPRRWCRKRCPKQQAATLQDHVIVAGYGERRASAGAGAARIAGALRHHHAQSRRRGRSRGGRPAGDSRRRQQATDAAARRHPAREDGRHPG